MGELCRIVRHLGSGIRLGVSPEPRQRVPARSAAIYGAARSLRCLFEIALVFVRFDHLARFIVNPNHSVMGAAELLCVSDCIAGSVRSVIPEPTERQHIGN